MNKTITLILSLMLLALPMAFATPVAAPGLEKCWDGIDNDLDGDIDMADPDCEHFVAGNPTCADLGYDNEVKIEEPDDYVGTWTYDGDWDLDGHGTFLVSTGDETYFDWSSDIGISAVIAKGGDNANVYEYDPEATSDYGLHPPVNNGGNIAGISHITVCFDDGENEIPEFGTMGAGLALLGAAGFVAYRKRKN
ncbi:LPXTG cell wall anchor domain-containing protein [Candidatus Woesearchaeota archaeon]|nr:LPXTG cell wall anchor domain-containing protein [Candidatus Woesearchaeota archaeon]